MYDKIEKYCKIENTCFIEIKISQQREYFKTENYCKIKNCKIKNPLYLEFSLKSHSTFGKDPSSTLCSKNVKSLDSASAFSAQMLPLLLFVHSL